MIPIRSPLKATPCTQCGQETAANIAAHKKRRLKTDLTGYAFLLPSFLGFLILIGIPVLHSLVLSFTDWDMVHSFWDSSFVGLRNYLDLWKDPWFIASLKNNLIYTIFYVPCSLGFGLLFAFLLNKPAYARSAFRTVFFMPYISNVVAVSVVWMAIFHPTKGPVNLFLSYLGIQNPPMWLASTSWALPVLIFIGVWINLGYTTVIYLAALQNIPSELVEAAKVDGAGPWSIFLHIVIPLLSPTTFFLMITGIINSFKVFGTVNVITRGGPGTSTTVLVYYLYTAAFSYYKIGYASAIAWVLFFIIFVVTIIQWRGQKKWVNYM